MKLRRETVVALSLVFLFSQGEELFAPGTGCGVSSEIVTLPKIVHGKSPKKLFGLPGWQCRKFRVNEEEKGNNTLLVKAKGKKAITTVDR